MQEFLNAVFYPSLYAFLGVAGIKLWDWVKPKFQIKIDNADARAKEIDNEIKSAHLYKTLLDDLKIRLESAIQAIEERDVRIAERDKKIEERDKKIDQLLSEVEIMTDELRKFKQLNGKS